jgi:lysophospholipase L1-like esterase
LAWSSFLQAISLKAISYLAIGDSYTFGTGALPEFSFPSQLCQRLHSEESINIEKPEIIAKEGWTTNELLQAIEEANPSKNYDLVSLLIGANNQYRGYPRAQYSREFRQLLEKAIELGNGDPTRVFVVAIPDFGATPFCAPRAAEIHQDLLWYNTEAQEIAEEYGIPFADIFPISAEAAKHADLTADDKLHPSDKMYTLWMDVILPVARNILKNQEA